MCACRVFLRAMDASLRYSRCDGLCFASYTRVLRGEGAHLHRRGKTRLGTRGFGGGCPVGLWILYQLNPSRSWISLAGLDWRSLIMKIVTDMGWRDSVTSWRKVTYRSIVSFCMIGQEGLNGYFARFRLAWTTQDPIAVGVDYFNFASVTPTIIARLLVIARSWNTSTNDWDGTTKERERQNHTKEILRRLDVHPATRGGESLISWRWPDNTYERKQ